MNNKAIYLNLLAVCIILNFAGCNNSSNDKSSETSLTGTVQELTISPDKNLPGEVEFLTYPTGLKIKEADIKIFVNDISADIVMVHPNQIEFLVPELDSGQATVRLKKSKDVIGEARFTILSQSSKKIVFGTNGDNIELISETLSSDTAIPSEQLTNVDAAIRFEFKTQANEMISSGTVENNQSGMEAFPSPTGSIVRKKSLPTRFSILIPNLKGVHKISFFKREFKFKNRSVGNHTVAPISAKEKPWREFTIKNK